MKLSKITIANISGIKSNEFTTCEDCWRETDECYIRQYEVKNEI